MALAARINGLYARALYLPATILSQAYRRTSRRLRGVQRGQETSLPQADWRALFPARPIFVAQPGKTQGDVNLAELAVLATAAASVSAGSQIVEIGTFDGRTTLNLTINSPAQAPVFTLDLPPQTWPKYNLAPGERAFVEKPRSGRHFIEPPSEWATAAGRITQLFGDSATYDWSAHRGRAGLVFVDGSHAYDYVMADTATALSLIAPKGVVIWHDYGVWDGVTRALEEIEASRHLGLRHVRGTSLVVWKS
jgi:predicted O-methyltransferase YrrM